MSHAKPDYSTWLTKQQAADMIGVSKKAIERYAHAKKLEQAFRPQSGSRDAAIFHPEDVARLARERRPLRPFVMPVDAAPALEGHALAPVAIPAGNELLHALVRVMSQSPSPTSQTAPALFLTVAEAADVSGLSQAYLRRAIAAGTLPAIRDRGWRIRRRDLEAL